MRPASMLLSALLALGLLLLAPAVRADEGPGAGSPMTGAVEEIVAMGPMPAPAYGAAAPLFIAQLATAADGEWFDPGWAAVELALGTAGSAYASWLLSTHVEADAGMITTYTSSYALAMNLRLVTHGIMSMALYSDGEDERARRLVPSISVSPLDGGALATAVWAM